jgi:hypothetical protein
MSRISLPSFLSPELFGTAPESCAAPSEKPAADSRAQATAARCWSEAAPNTPAPKPADARTVPVVDESLAREVLLCRAREGVELCMRTADLPVARELDLKHHWLRTGEREAGMGAEGAGVPGRNSDSPYVTETAVNDHTGEADKPGSRCVPIKDVNEACVTRELQDGRKLGRWSPTNQCQTFAAEVLERCSTKPVELPDTSRPHPGKI